MDIAALSMAMSQMNLGTQVGVAVTKLSMDVAAQTGEMTAKMIKEMAQSVNPHLGQHVDIQV